MAEDTPAIWRERLHSAQQVYEHEFPIWQTLEDAVDGKFPDVVSSSAPFLFQGTDLAGWMRTGAQLDVNLMGSARDYYLAVSYDRFPTFRFSRDPGMDEEAVLAAEKLAERIAMDGALIPEARRAMDASMCRGQFILGVQVSDVGVSESEIVASTIPPGEWVDAAKMGGWDGKLPLGVDYDAVVVAAKTILDDPIASLQLQDKERLGILALQEVAQKLALREREAPHSLKLPSKITYEALPYGSWCTVDSSVTDYRRISWFQKTLVLTQEEFQRSPRFSDEAKRNVKPLPLSPKDGGIPVGQGLAASRADAKHILDHYGRIVLREIWDKTKWERRYIADGYEGFCEKSKTYPYMNYFGRPLFKNFFPFVWRTPKTKMGDGRAKILGRGVLEDGWPTQIEYIKTISAYVKACKDTKRILIAGPGCDQASVQAVQDSDDMDIVKPAANYTVAEHGGFKDQFAVVPQPPAPVEYLNAAQVVKGDFASSVHIAPAALFGKSTDPTASQEQISQAGAASVQGDVIRVFEDGTAEAAHMGLMLFLEYANPQEFEAYLGAEALLPRSSITGQPPDKPSIAGALKALNLSGSRLTCRFASGTEQEDALYIKNLQDFLALNSKVLDGMGHPYMDPRPILMRLAKAVDIEFKPYEPSPDEKAAQMAMMQNPQQPGGDGEEGGEGGGKGKKGNADDGQQDSRTANNGRGAPNVPGREERNRQPAAKAGASGNLIRSATSRA